MDRSPSLAGRAAMALVLMVGFYVLALGIAGLLIWVPFAEVEYAHRIHIKLTIICLLGAGIILWSVLPRRDSFQPPGPRLDRASQPRLFALVGDVATATGQQEPAEVYLIPDVNAWVSSRDGFMGIGSRRIMGLGLPLLQALGVSELRAVIAHEFGHYHGGDVALGPLIYNTRAAIGRTLHGLENHSGLLMKPFEWYGAIFLRLTHAISRAQEYAADRLAARVAGPESMKGGLRKLEGAAAAYTAYWRTEVEPVLGAGYRPPIAAGFAHFLHTASIAKALTALVRKAESEDTANVYDTHPPLRERLAALDDLPDAGEPPDLHPAIDLLEDSGSLEKAMLGHFIAMNHLAKLSDIAWEAVGTRVLVPQWEQALEENASALTGATFASLPDLMKDPGAFAGALPGRPTGVPDSVLTDYARWLAGGLLALALVRRGGTVRSLPGEPILVTTPQGEVEPFAWVEKLGDAGLDAEEWRERCRRFGVGEELLVPVTTSP
jgi:heat shock protein HtpX